MPLSPFQKEVLKILARRRTPESHVAGGAPIAARSLRETGDIDIFNDRETVVEEAATTDANDLTARGYQVDWSRRLPGIWSARIIRGGDAMRVEWAHDSAHRFYPALADDDFGYVLHAADLITNKVAAAASRSEARDLVDLVELSRHVPIEAAVLAVAGKDPGMTPEVVMSSISRFGRHHQSSFDALRSTGRIDGATITQAVRAAMSRTRQIAVALPTDALGRFYYEDGRIVIPDPKRLTRYTTREPRHAGVGPAADPTPVAEIARRYESRGR